MGDLFRTSRRLVRLFACYRLVAASGDHSPNQTSYLLDNGMPRAIDIDRRDTLEDTSITVEGKTRTCSCEKTTDERQDDDSDRVGVGRRRYACGCTVNSVRVDSFFEVVRWPHDDETGRMILPNVRFDFR
jgi:hypothetical protein